MFHNTSYPHSLISTPLRAARHLFTSYSSRGITPLLRIFASSPPFSLSLSFSFPPSSRPSFVLVVLSVLRLCSEIGAKSGQFRGEIMRETPRFGRGTAVGTTRRRKTRRRRGKTRREKRFFTVFPATEFRSQPLMSLGL